MRRMKTQRVFVLAALLVVASPFLVQSAAFSPVPAESLICYESTTHQLL
jgi:hypothetical protein